MKQALCILLLSVLASGCAGGGAASIATPPAAPGVVVAPGKRLLIIGDSISMGYTTYLQKDLALFYDVQHVGFGENSNATIENAQGTTHTLANVDRWLVQAGHVDVIVWNNGLWNARDPAVDPQAPGNATDLATYQSELTAVATKLQATGARVIFFGTTDIPSSGSTFIPGRDLDENLVARAVVASAGMEFYDLRALSVQNPRLHLSTDPIHFNTQGYSLFGEFIADMVRADFETSN